MFLLKELIRNDAFQPISCRAVFFAEKEGELFFLSRASLSVTFKLSETLAFIVRISSIMVDICSTRVHNKNANVQEEERSFLLCHICGDRARGMNFNAISCMSCKMFFRRNALRHGVSMFIYFSQ